MRVRLNSPNPLDWPDFTIPTSPCPDCGELFEAAANAMGQKPPGPGQIAICARCGAGLIFDTDLTVRRMTTAEWEALPEEIQAVCQLFEAGLARQRKHP